MLNKMLAKKLLLSRGSVLSSVRYQSFASLNAQTLDSALSNPTHLNWHSFFSAVKANEIADSDARTVGKLLKVLTFASESHGEAEKHSDLYHAIDEYFRKRFRNLSTEEALDILLPLGEDSSKKLAVLDDKFWVWETLEQATRNEVENMNEA